MTHEIISLLCFILFIHISSYSFFWTGVEMLNHNKIFLVTKDEDESERKSERSEREGYGLSPDTVVQFYMDSEVDSGNGQ